MFWAFANAQAFNNVEKKKLGCYIFLSLMPRLIYIEIYHSLTCLHTPGPSHMGALQHPGSQPRLVAGTTGQEVPCDCIG